jgi:hypothetical protein
VLWAAPSNPRGTVTFLSFDAYIFLLPFPHDPRFVVLTYFSSHNSMFSHPRATEIHNMLIKFRPLIQEPNSLILMFYAYP